MTCRDANWPATLPVPQTGTMQVLTVTPSRIDLRSDYRYSASCPAPTADDR